MARQDLAYLLTRLDATAATGEAPAQVIVDRGLTHDAVSGIRSIAAKIMAGIDKGWKIKVDLIHRCGMAVPPLD